MTHEQPAAIGIPPIRDVVLLGIAMLTSAGAAAFVPRTDAPGLAIAFWRSFIGVLFAVAISVPTLLRAGRPDRRKLGISTLGGCFLAANISCWIISLTMTTVASACALLAAQSIVAALIAHVMGRRMPAMAWFGTALAVIAVSFVTGADFSLSGRAVAGDIIAFVAGAFGAAYFTTGGVARKRMSNSEYGAICFAACTVVTFAVCLATGTQLVGYSTETWLKIGAITLGAQIISQTLMNQVLRTTSATMVSLSVLTMIPLGGAIAYIWFGQRPPLSAIPGMAMMIIGVYLVLRASSRTAAGAAVGIDMAPAAVPVGSVGPDPELIPRGAVTCDASDNTLEAHASVRHSSQL